MANMLCRTKGNASPKGKPRVYFTCHPEDFDRYFDKVCGDIFESHNCAIYYTKDMRAPIAPEERATDLESNNLLVVPVTFKLLTQPNRAMNEDIPFAMEKHIPVLPIMMESGIDEFYSRPNKFGELQYLNPYSNDATEVPYRDKLKHYLESVLISDEMAKRVRAAFDAYIFLSYRKKDRRYANELMRLIHSHPECRDIAIWYDEFLTPGVSFRENIEKVLGNSKLFALLVTPKLLEEPDGKPNFVMGEEYPAARKSGIDILPAEMEETDKDSLREKFQDIPPCVDPRNDDQFRLRLLESVAKIAISTNNDDPMHTFLIGLAYLEGIDVEVDRERGLALITSAAEQNLPEAMERLYKMYNDGTGVPLDYRKAVVWVERLADHYQRTQGEEHPDTLTALNNLAMTYSDLGNHKKAVEMLERTYQLRCKVLGEDHPATLTALNNLTVAYGNLGEYGKALELQERVHALRCKILGDEHPDTLIALSNLAALHSKLGSHEKAAALLEQVHSLQCRNLGEEHPDTLITLDSLAVAYSKLGNNAKADALQEKAYVLLGKVLGEEHPATLNALHNMATTYYNRGEHKKALPLQERVYALRCSILGEDHPTSLLSLDALAWMVHQLGDHKRELKLQKKAYELRCKALGENHPGTLAALTNLTVTYFRLGNSKKALVALEKLYSLQRKVLGEEDPDTLRTLNNLAVTYGKLGNRKKAQELLEQVYILQCRVWGEKHPTTLLTLKNLIMTYGGFGNSQKALARLKKLHTQSKP